MSKGLVLGAALVMGVGVGACTDEVETSDTAQMLSGYSTLPNGLPIPNRTGLTATVSAQGSIDLTNEFFQDLGTNGRRCVSCHPPTAGWTITPAQVQLASRSPPAASSTTASASARSSARRRRELAGGRRVDASTSAATRTACC